MEFCDSCEKKSVVFGKTKIKVGREIFETETEHCTKCGKVAIDSQLQSEIDKWAGRFTKSIVELQPYFTEAMATKIAEYSAKFNLHKSEFMKACTVFFLLRLTNADDFKTIRAAVLEKAHSKYPGKREKICVPMKYQLFKKIDLYARLWRLEYDANVLEEAVQICVTVLDHAVEIEKNQRRALIHFVKSHALAS